MNQKNASLEEHNDVVKGRFVVEHRDRDDNLKATYEFPNGIVDEGMNHILDTQFTGSAQIATWYIGLIDNAGFSAVSDADTLASHGGWSESTTYTESNRVTWDEDAASSRSISNSTTADFSINATGNLKGIFISSNNVKSTGNTGTLWSTANFSSVVATANGDTLKVTYTVSG
jgi:hypothetical protein